ncbi:MAG: glycine cleavage system aminomethyltransferase GcvT [Phycisphaerae bacterium]|nr:glycine cleavage system aminomethyltransferase GcvT [Phycisphaerae bacterium]
MKRTVFYDKHIALGGKIVDFSGWEMPIQYPAGIVKEHLATRRNAGLFDVSHMGRFIISGAGALDFLQYTLSNNAAALEVGQAQYTIIPTASGSAIDDAYLYRPSEDEFLLVVNASNLDKDWTYLNSFAANYDVQLLNRSTEVAMIALQGPESEAILNGLIEKGKLPADGRNNISQITISNVDIFISRTGYTGEPVCFELFIENAGACAIWDALIEAGAEPVGLGARDTLRLEGSLPLYGHEMGDDIDGNEMPLYACPLAKFAVSFDEVKGDFIGKEALQKQANAIAEYKDGNFSNKAIVPRTIKTIKLIDKGIARAGSKVFAGDKEVGYITSGTMVPYWIIEGELPDVTFTDKTGNRAIGLALIDCELNKDSDITVQVRNKQIKAQIVINNLKGRKPPVALPVV